MSNTPGYQVGNRIAEGQREQIAMAEAEAWRVAQLAATLLAGAMAAGNAENAHGAVKLAQQILQAARASVTTS